MAAILNLAILDSAILDSAILVFPLKLAHTCQDWFPPFAQKNLHSFILTQLDDGSHLEFYCCWIKETSLIHSDSTWWWQPSWILLLLDYENFTHSSDSTWWCQPSWILLCWIQTPCFLFSDSLKNTLTPLWLWLKLIQCDSNSFILTQLDDGSHLEFCHLGFSHLSLSLSNSLTLAKIGSHHLQKKKPSLIHCDSTLDDGSQKWILLMLDSDTAI